MEYTCTAENESDAYAQISDSGISPGALIGTVLIEGLDTIEQVGGTTE